jgi:hypothetical protein
MKTGFVIGGCIALLLLGAYLNTFRWRYWRQWAQVQGALAGGAVGVLVGYSVGRGKGNRGA